MKKIQTLISASAIAAVTALPVFAQQADYTTTSMGNETAMDIAQRVGACGGSSESRIADASFVQPGNLIRVKCVEDRAGGLKGGLGTGAAIAGAVAVVALIAVAASDGSGSSTTSTPGT